MTSFNLFASSTTARILASGDDAFISGAGTLAVSGTAAVSLGGTGTIDIAVLGALVAFDADAVNGTSGAVELQIGSAGEILSTAADAVDIDIAVTAEITNFGTVTGDAIALNISETAANASFTLLNAGRLSASSAGVFADLGVGGSTIDIVNTSEITAAITALDLVASKITLRNSGTIAGNVLAPNSGSNVTIVNTGTILGSISLAGSGEIDLRHGTVTGTVSGGQGDTVFRIDDGSLTLVDIGTSSFDTVFSSATFALGDKAGIERLVLTGAADIRAIGSIGDDQLVGNRGDNRLTGHFGADALDGAEGDDVLRGGDGSDTLQGGRGDDTLGGGLGDDVLNYGATLRGVTVNLGDGTATGGEIDTDKVSGFERVTGGLGADALTGDSLANVLEGGLGTDTLGGSNGNDTLIGGAGGDVLRGGGGIDQFRFVSLAESSALTPDTILDFNTSQFDVIDLSAIDPDPGANAQFFFGGAAFLAVGIASVRVFQDAANNITVIEARDTTDATVDLRIELVGLHTLTSGSFLL